MKKRSIIIFIIILLIAIVFSYLFIRTRNNYKNYNSKNIILDENRIQDKREYDCSFTQTWRVVNTLDGYIAEVPEWSYVALDKFQSHSVYAHLIPTNLKTMLKNDKYYEFTYSIKGTGIINNINDVTSYLIQSDNEIEKSNNLVVSLTIKETNKQGLEQIQENICK